MLVQNFPEQAQVPLKGYAILLWSKRIEKGLASFLASKMLSQRS